MIDDFYSIKSQDYSFVKGDTVNIAISLKDKNKIPIDVTQMDATFTIRNPITDEIITALQKTHNDIAPDGDGIYFNGDTYQPVGLGLTADNQLVVVLNYTDTATLDPGVYPYDIELTITGAYISKFTPVRGNLIIKKEQTPSV